MYIRNTYRTYAVQAFTSAINLSRNHNTNTTLYRTKVICVDECLFTWEQSYADMLYIIHVVACREAHIILQSKLRRLCVTIYITFSAISVFQKSPKGPVFHDFRLSFHMFSGRWKRRSLYAPILM